jgi:hypothetical protein
MRYFTPQLPASHRTLRNPSRQTAAELDFRDQPVDVFRGDAGGDHRAREIGLEVGANAAFVAGPR